MRIDEKDIQTHIAELLTDNSFNVIASETDEGFAKPAVFVNVYPATIELQGTSMEHVTDTVEIKYIPTVETVEHCADIAQAFRQIFMYKPFAVSDRRLTIERIEFDIENRVLYCYFDVDYYQETPDENEYENMENLNLQGGI